MFDSKVKSLFPVPVAAKTKNLTSAFVDAGMKKGAETLSGNGALKYSSTGSDLVDQFGVMGSFKAPRAFKDISSDMSKLWGKDKWEATAFAIYLRMISRQTTYLDGTKTVEPQKGGELKHEGIMRMIWLHVKDEKVFWDNIGLFISAGSWKDVFTMLSYDLVHNGWNKKMLNWEKFGNLLLTALENKNTSDLVKKYLPAIKANSTCKTLEAQADNVIAKWICSLVFGTKEGKEASTYKAYRKLKTSGTAHEWQKLISTKQFDRIDFNKIHGRALAKLVKGKFLDNQGLTSKYEAWVTAPETKDVKYTGFVHELFEKYDFRATKGQKATIDKQFDTLVTKAGEGAQSELIVVRDTSGSMSSTASGTKMSCLHISKALALYFSSFLKGRFANAWIEFNSTAKMHQWKGETPTEKWENDNTSYIGSTKFQSVISLFVQLKKSGVNEEDFPKGILCISDSEFNPTSLGKTNVDAAKDALRAGGFSDAYVNNFIIVLWNLQSNHYGSNTGKKFETHGAVQNVFYFSGYSAATVAFLTNEEIKTAEDLVQEALKQELLQRVVV